jgi:hypothetical protein
MSQCENQQPFRFVKRESKIVNGCYLLSTFYFLPTLYWLFPIAYCLLPIAYCLLPACMAVPYSLPSTFYQLRIGC